MTTCKDILKFIEQIAPPYLAEDWDNVGLLIGNPEASIKNILLSLDVTSKTVEYAINNNIDLIVSHHPVIFKGIKKIVTNDITGNIIYKLIQNDINVYSAHTNLDFTQNGINQTLAEVLNLTNVENLKTYKPQKLYKIAVFVPEENIDQVRNAMSSAGAGHIGNYSDCSFMMNGIGTFKPLEGSNPYIGTQNKLEQVHEIRLEMIVIEDNLKNVISSMINAHPYEEVAYDIYELSSTHDKYGFGKKGILKSPVNLDEFINTIKNTLNIQTLKLIGNIDRKIQTIGIFCGSLDESVLNFINDVDILVTGDVKYHTALNILEQGICVIDAGHFNTEKIILNKLEEQLKFMFPEINILINSIQEDPFKCI